MHNAGVIYEHGYVAKDPVAAIMWYLLAVSHYHMDSRADVRRMSNRLSKEQLAEAMRRGDQWNAEFDKRSATARSAAHQ